MRSFIWYFANLFFLFSLPLSVVDTILPTDPHFAELIGRGRGGGGGGNRSSNQSIYSIGKLTDAHDLHVIASTLKLYFRELREAVIPAELYLEALEAAHSPARATGLLERLPPVNRATLSYLIRFLQVSGVCLFLPFLGVNDFRCF